MTDKQSDKSNLTEEQVVEEVTRRLDRQADELDAATLSRLRQSRAAAMAELEKKSSAGISSWVWGGGFAGASVFAVALLVLLNEEPPIDQGFEQILADTEILSAQEELEFFEELEFYVWLEEQGLNPGEV